MIDAIDELRHRSVNEIFGLKLEPTKRPEFYARCVVWACRSLEVRRTGEAANNHERTFALLTLDPERKLFQTLPGQGWRALIVDGDVDGVKLTPTQIDELPLREEPVIAWVAFRDDYTSGEAATHIAAMVRSGSKYGDCELLTTSLQAVVFIAPGETRNTEHETTARLTFKNLSERYERLNAQGTK